ncbi:DUF5372 family protein [Streptomyces sp. NBC_01455]|uniref:DUF5372 family protein n=1 Tax=Streptomyces sp. NBC_01455 TaxID=2903874 RepID=UPI003FCD5169
MLSIALVVQTILRISTSNWRKGTNSAQAFSQRTSHSAPLRGVSEDTLLVTHPFHPLSGRRLRVCRTVRRSSGLVFICTAGDGVTVTLPQAWTDRGPAPDEHRLATAGLGALSALVDALMSRGIEPGDGGSS